MFTEEQKGKAEAAIDHYSEIFKQSSTKFIARYEAGNPNPEGWVSHAQFKLENQLFVAMDSGIMHGFQFNEAFSFVINCENQDEINYYWEKLTSDGGSESRCGWLKDKFGVSWQVIPQILGDLLNNNNPQKSQNVMQAMLKMNKLDIEILKNATF
jgi:predicted 3-demethylubiquinone-9 3-methyltransferase (glyoxalase superfamily)